MSRPRLRVFFLFLVLSIAVLLGAETPPPESASWLASYRSWRPLLQEPKPVPYELYYLCVIPPPDEVARMKKRHGPHSDHYIQVFANPVAEEALRQHPGKPLPVGSVIAKDKLPQPTTDASEGVAFMVKRADAGFKGSGGWEFFYFPSGKHDGRIADQTACSDCHRSANHDYIKDDYPLQEPDDPHAPMKPGR